MLIARENRADGLTLDEARAAVNEYFGAVDCAGKRLLMLIPDNTRSGPIGDLFQLAFDALSGKVAALDVLVSLGTHQPMDEGAICQRLDITLEQRRTTYASVRFFNHEWEKPETFKSIGTITAPEVEAISNGLFSEEVDVALNRMIFDYDELLILGPVFPHEVVGFSGGHKYIFPGIAADGIINFFHWLGAVVTNPWINGNKWTPTRQVVEKAASFIDMPRRLIAVVAAEGRMHGLFLGDPVEAWERAADVSDKVHIVYKDRAYDTVLGLAPQMYEDVWTAGKVMYKLEPVVADGGTLIIHAPHITEISYTHGEVLDAIGYHTRDYFLKQWDRFTAYPRGVIAHSTHVKGIGTFADGVEKPRVNVVLATAIPRARCEKVNLGYMDPATIDVDAYRGREHEGVLVVEHAGEMLHRLSSGAIPTIPGDRH